MKKERSNYITDTYTKYEECYVSFIDILGFKDMIDKSDFITIASIFNKIIFECNCFDSTLSLGLGQKTDSEIKFTFLSDSIVLSIKCDITDALKKLIKATSYIQTAFIKRNPSILTRGGISKGGYFSEGNFTFGPALVSAYNLENTLAKNPRVILDEKINCEINSEIDCFLIKDKDGFYFVDYLKIVLIDTYFQSFCRQDILNKLREDECNEIKEKYNWYKDYFEISLLNMNLR